MPVTSLQLPLMKIPHSHQNNAPRPSTCMGGTWRRPLLPKCKQLHKVDKSWTIPLGWTLLERMGLGNQTLMARLGLPLRTSPSPDMKGQLGELVMMREMIGETLPGIGISPGVDHHGGILMKGVSITRKTHLLQNTYLSNFKQVLQNLELQQSHCRWDISPMCKSPIWTGFWPSRHTTLITSLESCDQCAFLIGFPEVLQNLLSTSHKIKLNHAILTMILPCLYLPWGMRNGNSIFLLILALIQNPLRALEHIIHHWKGISEGNTTPLSS